MCVGYHTKKMTKGVRTYQVRGEHSARTNFEGKIKKKRRNTRTRYYSLQRDNPKNVPRRTVYFHFPLFASKIEPTQAKDPEHYIAAAPGTGPVVVRGWD